MNKIEEKRAQRFEFLKVIYDKTEGSQTNFLDMWDIGDELGWDRQTTEITAQYLVGEGLIEFHALGGILGITHFGVKEIEHAVQNPNEATAYFPATINIMSGDFRGSIVNMESTLTNLSQNIGTLTSAGDDLKNELRDLIDQLKDALKSAPPEKAEEAEAVAWAAQSLVQASAEERPNRFKIQITKDGLRKAVKSLADIIPSVLSVIDRIVSCVDRLIA